ncbi:hypothetical protein F511_31034 [Dorcoceras hygrometricum]|uniref:Uncharacterized protein n=1 Tax=Dorcoceras hygrometricum TaxID=472368 RepID=A0A2Z7CTL4_9LAMI|nr:hypothetical protein F511_31034 [Dorcoceras hygrometricum]
MDLLRILAAFCFMFVHCAASGEIHLPKVVDQNDAKFNTASSLPRKLQLSHEEASNAVLVKEGFADKNAVPDNKNLKIEASPALVYSIAVVYANSNGNSVSLYQQKGQYTLITFFDRSWNSATY